MHVLERGGVEGHTGDMTGYLRRLISVTGGYSISSC